MTKGGKRFLGVVFLLAAAGCVIAFFVATNNYNDGWVVYGFEPPERPNPVLYFGAAGGILVGAFVMFNMASNDKTSPGLFGSSSSASQGAGDATKDTPDGEEPA